MPMHISTTVNPKRICNQLCSAYVTYSGSVQCLYDAARKPQNTTASEYCNCERHLFVFSSNIVNINK
jgi:hypothetical protein